MRALSSRFWRVSQLTFFCASTQKTEVHDPDGYTFAPIDQNRLTRDTVFATKNRAQRFLDRWDSEHTCYGYMLPSGEVASYIWLSLASDLDTTVPFRFGVALALQQGHAYVWDCATSSAHQNRGLYRSGLVHARALAAKSGMSNALICADTHNVPSLRGIRAAGFKPYCKTRVRQLGPVRRVDRDGACIGMFWGHGTVRLM